ncbi:MAG: DUF5320 domain-containing protein [Acidobacteria bacterium]|nr:DUF5320 domain-containing protein [Acidobacteriota bacterium]
MPRGDRTGPRGMGSMTGRGTGFCAGVAMPGYENPMPGRGLGMGFGRSRGSWSRGFGGGGRGWRNMFYASGQPGWMRFGATAAPVADPDPQMEKQALKNQADYLQSELDSIRKRLEEVEKETGQQ